MGNLAKEHVLAQIKEIKLTPKNFLEDDGTVTYRFSYNSYKRVCIITEDRGNGLQFFNSYIHYNYPDISGVIIGSTGNGGFRYILEEYDNYDVYIIVLDRGIIKQFYDELISAINEQRKKLSSAKFYIFQPNCLEEVLLSFYRLTDYIQLNNSPFGKEIMTELESVLLGTQRSVQYNKYKTLKESTIEKICERYIYELTKNTPFECYHGQKRIKNKQPYIPAYLSPCWRCPCCKIDIYDNFGKIDKGKCAMPMHENKMDFIAEHSLLCGFTYLIDKIFGNKYHNHYWSNIDTVYFNQLVQEV